MKTKIIILVLILVAGFGFRAKAQDKIAYADIQLILNYMPETKTMAQTLQTYGKKLEEAIEPKAKYFQQKQIELEEWAQANQNATQEQFIAKAQEMGLEKLQKEIQQASADAEQKLAKKQADLMEPITEKLQTAVKDVAAAKGYTVVINKTDGAGVSIVLHGPEERDLTKEIMIKLGIKIPEN
ncbi:MAG: OmpH family outer membrane protein [Bacteroidia bacterium]